LGEIRHIAFNQTVRQPKNRRLEHTSVNVVKKDTKTCLGLLNPNEMCQILPKIRPIAKRCDARNFGQNQGVKQVILEWNRFAWRASLDEQLSLDDFLYLPHPFAAMMLFVLPDPEPDKRSYALLNTVTFPNVNDIG
jgi:hypothetical protein